MLAATLNRKQLLRLYDEAAKLADQGNSPAGIQVHLCARGVSDRQATEIVGNLDTYRARLGRRRGPVGIAGLIWGSAGLLVFGLGVGLFLGNVSGLFPSVPFAGYFTMAIGGVLLRQAMTATERRERGG